MTLAYTSRPPPVASPRPPLLVLLHGIGADENDLAPVADALDPRLHAVSLRAPYEAEPMGFAWYAIDWRTSPPTPDLAQAEASLARLIPFLAGLPATLGTDPARTFLFGFSQGATMALALALARPELARGVILHSGRALPGIERRVHAPLDALEVLVLHGIHDDVLPVERGREIRDLLAPLLGERLRYREHDAGHFVSEASLADATAWIAERVG